MKTTFTRIVTRGLAATAVAAAATLAVAAPAWAGEASVVDPPMSYHLTDICRNHQVVQVWLDDHVHFVPVPQSC